MGRVVVLVIDSFGIGEMEEANGARPADKGANTCLHLLQADLGLTIPHLTKLGLLHVLNHPQFPAPNVDVCAGSIGLAHFGADTFWGHQELMGTKPLMPYKAAFSTQIDAIEELLLLKGYSCQRLGNGPQCLLVNQALVIGDNLETDLGTVYNLSACLDLISYKEVVNIGRLVRSVVKVARVIAFGGSKVSLSSLLNAMEIKGEYIGINAPKSGVYDHNYQVIHLGYGVDPSTQVPALLHKISVPTYLLGKVADIVENPEPSNSILGLVDTKTILDQALKQLSSIETGFFCINIQETDLAGHAQDPQRYIDKVNLVDLYLPKIQALLSPEDLFIVTADHGNDPTIGHSQHTREYVPLLIFGAHLASQILPKRKTLADIGATVCDYFNATAPQFGQSFLT
ncbi:MAG: phosphopentomutase [Enterovibrio sp.]